MNIKSLVATSIMASAIVSASAYAAPSAKFAAVYSDEASLSTIAEVTNSTGGTTVSAGQQFAGHTLATIKVPEQKELLVGLSAEIGLLTSTQVKGKNGGSGSAEAGARVSVQVSAIPAVPYLDDQGNLVTQIDALPGPVMLSERVQELSATLGGVIESCTDGGSYDADGNLTVVDADGDGIADNADGTIDVNLECYVTDEEIGLLQNTTAAHHFNFVFPDMKAGQYTIKAVFISGSSAEVTVDLCEDTTDDGIDDCANVTFEGTAKATSVINKYMMTVQEVRAVKGSIEAVDLNDSAIAL